MIRKHSFHKWLASWLCLLTLLLLLPCGQATAMATATAGEGESDAGALRFGRDGTFTVMVLSDAQETQFPSPLFVASVRRVLSEYAPDLVVFLGDQLEGSHPLLRIGSAYDNTVRAMTQVVALVEEAGVPFVAVPGNHDYDAPVGMRYQAEFYRSRPGCAAAAYEQAARVSVYPYAGDEPALNLYLFDSGKYTEAGGYGAVPKEQVAWYLADTEAARAKNARGVTPAVAFTHVAPEEIYRLFTPVEAGTAGALHGTTGNTDALYLPDEARIFTGNVLEAPCPSEENNGLFDAFSRGGDVFLAVFGHDHLNSFIGTVDGVDMAAAPGCTYTGYGDARARGVRLFRFREDNVRDYETIHVRFALFDGSSSFLPVRYYLLSTSKIPNTVKVLACGLLLLAAILVLSIKLAKKGRTPVSPAYPEAPEDDEEPEDPYL